MREANGIELSGREYSLLKRLVRSSDPQSAAMLAEREEERAYVQIMGRLDGLGLVYGQPSLSGYGFLYVTESGRSFVEDCERQDEQRRRERRGDRLFQFLMALLAAALTAVFEKLLG